MWRYLMFFAAALRHRNKPPACGLFEPVSMDFQVGVTDIDFNFHLNNAKYLKYLDLARTKHWIGTGILWRFLRAGLNAVMTNTEISHLRELRTWQRFTITTRIVGWDEKYVYFDLRFISDGRLCAHAYQRLVGLRHGKTISMAEVLKRTSIHDTSPELPEPVLAWKTMLEAKKRATMNVPADESGSITT